MSKKKTSDFGAGLVYNLVLFMDHSESWGVRNLYHIDKNPPKSADDIVNYGHGLKSIWQQCSFYAAHFEVSKGDHKASISHALEMWANGATDHLYEMKYPKSWKGTVVAKKIDELKSLGLKMGHGFNTAKTWTMKDFIKLQKLTKEIAFMIDKKLKINPIKAQWE